jgi:hypothetical protein
VGAVNAQTERLGNDPRRLRLARLAAALVAAESAGAAAGAVFLAIETVRATATSTTGAIFLAVMAAVLAVGLAACAAGILQGRTWVRGPVVTWQLVQGGVAMRLTVLVAWWLGLPLLVFALIIGILAAGPWVLDPRERATG